MKIYILKLILIGILLDFTDHISTWYMVNYLDIGLIEGNPTFRTVQGKLDMELSNIALLTMLSIYIIIILLLLRDNVFPSNRNYTSLTKIEKEHRLFVLILFLLITAVFHQASVVLIWNPATDLGLTHALNFTYYRYSSLVIFIFVSIYWGLAVIWRYLTPEARLDYPYLAWLYKIGFMKDVI